MQIYLPCVDCLKSPYISKILHASNAQCAIASFFLPLIVASAICGLPVMFAIGNLK